MKIKYLIYPFLFIATLSLNAQETYEWTWAKRGGGWEGLTPNSASHFYDDEKVMDITVDQFNNYYFVAEVGKTETNFDGVDFANYNGSGYFPDLYIVSTDCQGGFRWQKSIGGASYDRSKSIVADEQGGIYISGWAFATETEPLHFDTDSITGLQNFDEPGPGNKNLFLIKYDTEGDFQWLRQPQKDNVTPYELGHSYGMYVEPNGTIHWLINMPPGTHVNGNVTVPSEMENGQWIVLKYDQNGSYAGHVPLPISGLYDRYATQFHYDPLSDQYYIASFKRGSSSPEIYTNGVLLQGSMLIAAFDNQGNQLWRHDNTLIYGGEIFDVITDEDSNIYITGRTSNYDIDGSGGDTMAGYTFTQSNGISGTNAFFLIKLDQDGNLLWGTNADETCRFSARTIAINGDEVAIGVGLAGQTWQGMVASRPENHLNDPAVVRFDKATGAIIAIEDIMGTSGYDDEITALAVDNNGNYVVGGIIKNALFTDHPTVPMISNSGGPSDFFVAQLAHTDCTETSSVEEKDFSNLKIYPNPTKDRLHIEANTNWASYKLYSIAGQTVAQGQLGKQEISLSALEAGIYFLELQDQEGRKEVVKVVKE